MTTVRVSVAQLSAWALWCVWVLGAGYPGKETPPQPLPVEQAPAGLQGPFKAKDAQPKSDPQIKFLVDDAVIELTANNGNRSAQEALELPRRTE